QRPARPAPARPRAGPRAALRHPARGDRTGSRAGAGRRHADRPRTGSPGHRRICEDRHRAPRGLPLAGAGTPGDRGALPGGAMDLNADVGEGMDDGPLLPFLTSASIACGLHAGSPLIMDRVVSLALSRRVQVGAHPGYADRENFGRAAVDLSPDEVRALVLYQVAALDGFVRAHGGRLAHVKAHGALYNRAARDLTVATAIAEAVRAYGGDLIVVGLAGSVQLGAARLAGLRAAGEAFADRRYLPDATL